MSKKIINISSEDFRLTGNNIIPEEINHKTVCKFKTEYLTNDNEVERIEYFPNASKTNPSVIEYFTYNRDGNGVLESISVDINWLTLTGATGHSTTILYTGDTTNQIIDNGQFFDGYNTSTDNIANGWTNVDLDTIRVKDGVYTHTLGEPDVYIGVKGCYVINGRVSVESNKTNTTSQIRLMLDTGSGYNEVGGCRSWANGKKGTGQINIILALNVGDKIKLQATREIGNGNAKLLPNGSSLIIIKHT